MGRCLLSIEKQTKPNNNNITVPCLFVKVSNRKKKRKTQSKKKTTTAKTTHRCCAFSPPPPTHPPTQPTIPRYMFAHREPPPPFLPPPLPWAFPEKTQQQQQEIAPPQPSTPPPPHAHPLQTVCRLLSLSRATMSFTSSVEGGSNRGIIPSGHFSPHPPPSPPPPTLWCLNVVSPHPAEAGGGTRRWEAFAYRGAGHGRNTSAFSAREAA